MTHEHQLEIISDDSRLQCDMCHSVTVSHVGQWCPDCEREGRRPPLVTPESRQRLNAQFAEELEEINRCRVASGLEPLEL